MKQSPVMGRGCLSQHPRVSLATRKWTFVGEDDVHTTLDRPHQYRNGISSGDIYEYRSRKRVTGDRGNRLVSGRVYTASRTRERSSCRLGVGQSFQSLRGESARVENVAASINDSDDARLTVSRMCGAMRHLHCQLAPNLSEAEDDDVRVLRMDGSAATDFAQPERVMYCPLCLRGVVAFDDD
jgi:hypothetical protein